MRSSGAHRAACEKMLEWLCRAMANRRAPAVPTPHHIARLSGRVRSPYLPLYGDATPPTQEDQQRAAGRPQARARHQASLRPPNRDLRPAQSVSQLQVPDDGMDPLFRRRRQDLHQPGSRLAAGKAELLPRQAGARSGGRRCGARTAHARKGSPQDDAPSRPRLRPSSVASHSAATGSTMSSWRRSPFAFGVVFA